MGYSVLYISSTSVKTAKKVNIINRFLLFTIGKRNCVALITTEPLLWKRNDTYFVYEFDQNTFSAKDNSVLGESIEKEFMDYLDTNPQNKYYTKKLKPDDLKPHLILEDIERNLLDGSTLSNLINKIHKIDKTEIGLAFLAGMGAGVVLLIIIGAVSPDTVRIVIGNVG